MSGKQMTLFEESEIQWSTKSHKPIFSEWSHSRRETLEKCARKYYYEYYGSNLRKAKEDPQKEKLHFLEALGNRNLRTGNILHLVIKTYLNKLRQEEEWSLNRLLHWARKIYHADLEYSRRYKHGTPLPDEKYPPTLLLEFYYGWPDAESLSAEAGKRLVTALTNFMTSENLAHFREGAGKASALIEESARLKAAGFTLSGRVDLVYWINDKVVIVDWKIGGSGSSDDSLQMLAYAWWAKQKFECPLDSIKIVERIDAYRRFEISAIPIKGVGVGISVDISTAFFSHWTVADVFWDDIPDHEQQRRQEDFESLSQRQRGQKGTLLYDLENKQRKCYFDKFLPGVTCATTGTLFVEELIEKGHLVETAELDVVDFHKSIKKGIRLWERIAKNRIEQIHGGTAFFLDNRRVVLTTTGAPTRYQGTASPVMLVSQSDNIDMVRVTKGVYASTHLNFSNPNVAQRLPLELKRTDDELRSRDSQEIRRIT